MKKSLVGALLFLSAHQVMADEMIRLQCEVTSKNQASFKVDELGKATLAVDVVLAGKSVRRISVYGEGRKLASVETIKNPQLKTHLIVDSSDARRWNIYNTWESLQSDPISARINIDRNSGEINIESKVYSGGEWQLAVYSGGCNKIGGNNSKF